LALTIGLGSSSDEESLSEESSVLCLTAGIYKLGLVTLALPKKSVLRRFDIVLSSKRRKRCQNKQQPRVEKIAVPLHAVHSFNTLHSPHNDPGAEYNSITCGIIPISPH
jgi:hypothetical protein